MPGYEYVCDNCGNRITIMRSFDEPDQDYDCPECGTTLTRIWNTSGPSFKARG